MNLLNCTVLTSLYLYLGYLNSDGYRLRIVNILMFGSEFINKNYHALDFKKGSSKHGSGNKISFALPLSGLSCSSGFHH